MNRRQFTFRAVPWMVGGSLLNHNLSAFAMAEGTDYSCKASSDIALPSLNLTKIINITFEIMWDVPYFEGETPTPFNDYQKAKLTAISNLRAQIWSSQEFKDAVQAFKFWKCPDTSAQVYENITSVKQKKVKYSLSINSGESASTSNGVTRLPPSYFCGESGTTANLLNTLSHEYTHTLEARPSGPEHADYPTFGYLDESYMCSKIMFWTKGRPRAVSYGIGCVTQHIAYPDTECGTGCGFWT